MQHARRIHGIYSATRARWCTSATALPSITPLRTGSVFCLGLGAGVFGSLVGMGGAFVVLPVLGGPFGMPAHRAIGTSMGAVLGTCLGGTVSFATKDTDSPPSTADILPSLPAVTLWGPVPLIIGDVNVFAGGCVVAFAAVFAVVGARCSTLVRDKTIRLAQGVFMMTVAPLVVARDYVKSDTSQGSAVVATGIEIHATPVVRQESPSVDDMLTVAYIAPLLAIGTVSGFLAGFFGVGGGAVTVPGLVLLMDFDYKTALGTSMAGTNLSPIEPNLTQPREGPSFIHVRGVGFFLCVCYCGFMCALLS